MEASQYPVNVSQINAQKPQSRERIIEALFSRLYSTFEKFKAGDFSVDEAIADKLYSLLSESICKLALVPADLPQLFTHFSRALSSNSDDEVISYLILKLMNGAVSRLQYGLYSPVYDRILSEELLAELAHNIVRCRTCFKSKLVLSIFLNIGLTSSSITEINSTFYHNDALLSDSYTDKVLRFLSSTNSYAYTAIIIKHFKHYAVRHNSSDALYALADSKLKYGYFELLNTISTQPGTVAGQLDVALKIEEDYHDSPLFQAVFLHFGMQSILNWCEGHPQSFLDYTNGKTRFKEAFELAHSMMMSACIKKMHPLLLNMSYTTLVTLLATVPDIFVKVLEHLNNESRSSNDGRAATQLSPTDVKMFNILIKLIEPDENQSIEDKQLVLQCFSVLLRIAAAMKRYQPTHPLIVFTNKYYMRVYDKVKDVRFDLSNSLEENHFIEPMKIDFISYGFFLLPEEVLHLYNHYIEHYGETDFYTYYLFVSSITKISALPGGLELCEKYFLLPKYNRYFVKRLVEISDLMRRTQTSHRISLLTRPLQRANLSDRSLLDNQNFSSSRSIPSSRPSTSSLSGNSTLRPSINDGNRLVGGKDHAHLLSASKEDEKCNNILADDGYLCRRIFEALLQIMELQPVEILDIDDDFTTDDKLLADEMLFDQVMTTAARKGIVMSDPLLCGLFDCQLSCFDSAAKYLDAALSFDIVAKNYSYIAAAANIYFVDQLFIMTLNKVLYEGTINTRQFSYLTNYVGRVFPTFTAKINKEKFFGDIYACETSISFIKMMRTIETFLLVFLCKANADSYGLVKDMISNMKFYFDLTKGGINNRLVEEVNTDLFIAIIDDDQVLIRSQKFFIKKVKQLFSHHLTKETIGLNQASSLIFKKLQDHLMIENLDNENRIDLESYAIFVAQVCGLNVTTEFHHQINEFKDTIAAFRFVETMFNTLTSVDIEKRKIAENVLAYELSPYVAVLVYKRIEKELNVYEKDAKDSMFTAVQSRTLSSYVSILNAFFKRLPGIILFQNSARIISIATSLADIIMGQYDLFSELKHFQESIVDIAIHFSEMKLRTIKFLHLLSQKVIELRVEGMYLIWKNEMVTKFLRWLELCYFREESYLFARLVSAFSGNVPKIKVAEVISKINRIYRDIVLELLSTLERLTRWLPVIRSNINYAKEVNTFRTIIFSNHYNTLLRLLKKSLADASKKLMNIKQSAEPRAAEFKEDDYSSSEHEQIVHFAINIISNLVRSNYDIGSGYILPLLAHKNPTLQEAFLRIFKNIFQWQEKALRWNEKLQDTYFYDLFTQMLSRPDSLICFHETVTPIEIDRNSQALFELLKAGGNLVNSLQILIKHDLKMCLNPLDMLRKNTLTTKLLSLVTKSYGAGYLKRTAGAVLTRIIKEKGYEVINTFSSNPNFEASEQFLAYFEELVDRFCSSISQVPVIIKSVLYVLRSEFNKAAGDQNVSSAGIRTLFFLRFVCPAVAYPEELGLVEGEVSSQVKKCFVLLTKALQNASNRSFNTERFPILKGYEDAIQHQIEKLSLFVYDISLTSYSSDSLLEEGLEPNMENVKVIYTFLINHAQEVRSTYMNRNVCTYSSIEDMYAHYEKVYLAFEEMGFRYLNFYPDVAEFIRKNKNKYMDLYELVSRSLEDPLSKLIIDAPFLREGVAKDGTQLFVFTYKLFAEMKVDAKLMAARIFQALCRVTTPLFYIVIDCTLHNEERSLDSYRILFDYLYRLAPEELANKCSGVIYVNISDKFSKNLPEFLANISLSEHRFLNPRFVKYSFLSVFDDKKIIDSLNLSDWTYNIITGGKDFINDILYLDSDSGKTHPLDLRITNRHVIYGFGERKKVKLGGLVKTFRTVNMEPLIDWRDLKETEIHGINGTFEAQSKLFEKKLNFASFRRSEIVRTFYLNMSRYQTNVYNENRKLSKSNKSLKTEELLGEGLMSIGLGLLSGIQNVRRSAYDLLSIVQSRFHLRGIRTAIQLGSISSPPRSTAMASSIFYHLAQENPQLTSQVITAFVLTITNGEEFNNDNRNAFIIIEPWIDHIYNQVYLDELENGPETVQTFISAIVRNIPSHMNVVQLNRNIWSKLLRKLPLMEVVIDEVIKEVMNRELSGYNWDNLATLVSINQSMEVCSEIVHQLLDGTRLSKSVQGQSSRLELYWMKIRFLFKVCHTLFFDQLFLIQHFLPQILYICSVYHRTGTQRVKSLVQELMVNVLNTLRSSEQISDSTKFELKSYVEELLGPQAEQIFGLNLNFVNVNMPSKSQTVNEFHSSYFAAEIINKIIARTVSLPEYRASKVGKVWLSRLISHTNDLVYNDDSIYQIKGLRLIGHLAALGVDDFFVKKYLLKVLDYMGHEGKAITFLSTLTMFFMNLGKIARGLRKDSIYFDTFIWFSIILCHFDNIILFEAGLSIASNVILNINENVPLNNEDIWNVIYRKQTEPKDLMLRYLSVEEFNLACENEVYLVTIMCKLLLSRQLINFMKCGVDIAIAKVSNSKKIAALRNQRMQLDSVAAFVPLYMACYPYQDFDEFMVKAGFSKNYNYVKLAQGNYIPKILLDFLLSKDKTTSLTLIVISKFFTIDIVSLKIKQRFLELMKYLFAQSDLVAEIVFPIIADGCEKLLAQKNASVELIRLVNYIQRKGSESLLVSRFNKDNNEEFLYQSILHRYRIRWTNILLEFSNNEGLVEDKLAEYKESRTIKLLYAALKCKEDKDEYVF